MSQAVWTTDLKPIGNTDFRRTKRGQKNLQDIDIRMRCRMSINRSYTASGHTADVLLSIKYGFYYGWSPFGRFVRLYATHGNAMQASSNAFLMSTH